MSYILYIRSNNGRSRFKSAMGAFRSRKRALEHAAMIGETKPLIRKRPVKRAV